jgi:hypothetical protein
MPAITDADITEVKALIKAGQIEDARALIEVCDDARAKRLLAQFNERYPPDPEPATPLLTSSINSSVIGRIVAFILLVLILGFFAAAYVNTQQTNETSQRDNIATGQTQAAEQTLANVLESICRSRFYDGVEDRKYSASELDEGCHAAIQDTLKVWPEQITYCVNRVGLFASQLSECLSTQHVVILRAYVIQARDNPELLQTPGQSPTLDWDVLTEFPVTQSVR